MLLQYCSKKHLKIKFLRYVAINIVKLMDLHREDKYATELTMLVCKYLPRLAKKELSEFFYAIINSVNRGW